MNKSKEKLVKELDALIKKYNNILKMMRNGHEIDLLELRALEKEKDVLLSAVKENGHV